MEQWRSRKIGYVPYVEDLSSPGDRRRFPYYARLRGLKFEVAQPGKHYDLVVVSTLADLTTWRRLPQGQTKVIFDLPDSYFAISPWEPKAMLRGTAKYIFGQHQHWEPSFHATLKRMCKRADAVVCSTPEQRALIMKHNKNTHAILDFHTSEAKVTKSSYTIGERINLVWEGLPINLFTFETIAPVLNELSARYPLALHLITDLYFKPYNGPVPQRSTKHMVERMLPELEINLYQWHRDTFAAIATACDVALIPMRMDIPLYKAKAENKLLLFWRLGMPVVTEATPAYARTMNNAGVAMTCETPQEWRETLIRVFEDVSFRRQAAIQGQRFADDAYGAPPLAARWDALMSSL